MAKKQPVEPPIDPEEERAQEHVREIMDKEYKPPETPPEPADPEPTPEVATEPQTAPDIPADMPADAELAAIKVAAEASLAEAEAELAQPAPEPAPQVPVPSPETAPEVASDVDEGFVVGQTNEPKPDEAKATAEQATPDDPGTAKAVDDITRAEADAALPKEDDSLEAPVVMKVSIFGRMKNAIYAWWDNPRKRYITLAILFAILAVILFVPSLRAKALNLVGVRSSIIVTTIDGTTNLPLENVNVTALGASGKTNADGEIKLTGVQLGKQEVKIAKAGFATVTKHIELGVRVQDLGEVTMKAVGTQYVLSVTDYLSGKPAADVPVKSGEATTKSDKNGKAILTVPPSDAGGGAPIDITVGGKIYRKETVKAPVDPTTVVRLKLVPQAPDVYISKESGKYDVYRIDIDGKNKKVILPGTGLETPNVNVSTNETGTYAAVVSSRDNKRNKDGYLLNTLTIVNTDDESFQTVDHSEQFVLLGWDGNALIYQQTVAGASAANSSRQKIFSYNVETGKRYQLANANYFGSALIFGDKLYYVVSSTDPSVEGNFSVVDLTGSNRKTIMKGTIWSFIRTEYNLISLQKSDNTWYEYKLGDSGTKPATPPVTYTSRIYVDSPDGKQSVWIDVRDSRGVVIKRDSKTGNNDELFTHMFAQYALHWVSPTAFVFRTASSNGAADYAASIDGGNAVKVADVSMTQGY